MIKMNICLVGLPSAGKSSIINSLVGKRVLNTGITRTTIEQTLYKDLVSDDHMVYNIYTNAIITRLKFLGFCMGFVYAFHVLIFLQNIFFYDKNNNELNFV